MVWRILLIIVVALVIGISGCAKKEEPAEPAKTVDQLKAEAEKEITEENLDDELDKMEAEINADVMSEQ